MRERVRELAEGGLVDAVAAGDDGAAAELYRRYHEPVLQHALSILRDREDAEDVAQIVLTRAIATMARHRPRRLRAWLMTVTRNESLMLLRSRLPKDALSPNLPAAGTVDGTFALREQMAGLVVDLRALPERQRAALVLRQLYELSYRDIGDLLGIRPGTARESVLEARRSLLTRAAGREQDCGDIRLLLRDGRARRAVHVRAHLEACASCRAHQPSLAGRIKGLLPLPEPMIPPLLLRLLGGPGTGARGAGGPAAAALATFAIGLGIMGEAHRGDDGPPRSAAPIAAVQPPDRDGIPVAASGASQQVRERGAAPEGSARVVSVSSPPTLHLVDDAGAQVADQQPEPERSSNGGERTVDPVEEEPEIYVEVMNGSVTVGGPAPVVISLQPIEPPQELLPAPYPIVESAPLVGALTR